jgi:uncharacterized phage infection (PIP) family protein YhgE
MKRYQPYDFEEGVLKKAVKGVKNFVKDQIQKHADTKDYKSLSKDKKAEWNKIQSNFESKLEQLENTWTKFHDDWSALYNKDDKSDSDKKKMDDLHKKWKDSQKRYDDYYKKIDTLWDNFKRGYKMERYKPYEFDEGIVDTAKKAVKGVKNFVKDKIQKHAATKDYRSLSKDKKAEWDKIESNFESKLEQLKNTWIKFHDDWADLYNKDDKSDSDKKKMDDLHKKWKDSQKRYDDYDKTLDTLWDNFKSKK